MSKRNREKKQPKLPRRKYVPRPDGEFARTADMPATRENAEALFDLIEKTVREAYRANKTNEELIRIDHPDQTLIRLVLSNQESALEHGVSRSTILLALMLNSISWNNHRAQWFSGRKTLWTSRESASFLSYLWNVDARALRTFKDTFTLKVEEKLCLRCMQYPLGHILKKRSARRRKMWNIVVSLTLMLLVPGNWVTVLDRGVEATWKMPSRWCPEVLRCVKLQELPRWWWCGTPEASHYSTSFMQPNAHVHGRLCSTSGAQRARERAQNAEAAFPTSFTSQ